MPTIPQLIAQAEGKVFVRRVFGHTDRPMVSVYAEEYYVVLDGEAHLFGGANGDELSSALEYGDVKGYIVGKVVTEYVEVGDYVVGAKYPMQREEFDWSFVSEIHLGYYSDFLQSLSGINRRFYDLIQPLNYVKDRPAYQRAIQECLPFIVDDLRTLTVRFKPSTP